MKWYWLNECISHELPYIKTLKDDSSLVVWTWLEFAFEPLFCYTSRGHEIMGSVNAVMQCRSGRLTAFVVPLT